MNKKSFKECFCLKEGNIKKCHSRGFLSAVSATFKNERGGDPRLDPAYQPCGTGSSGMTPFKVEALNKDFFRAPLRSGFTLIELLVVVLIIGILAAVALPQYNKVVKKAQGREALIILDALDKSVASYYLENGKFWGQVPLLDIPEPKHFYFSSDYVGESGHPQSLEHQLQVGCPGGAGINLENDDIKIISKWDNTGKRYYFSCEARNMGSCSDYFNCDAQPRQQIGSIYTGGDCNLQYTIP